MKTNLLRGAGFVASLLALNGCRLEEQIVDTPLSENFVRTQSDVATALNAVYGTLTEFNSFKFNVYSLTYGAADDISSTAAEQAALGLKSYNFATVQVGGTWNALYRTVNTANFLLDRIDNVPMPPDYKNRVKGELSFLRAFAYFYLVRFFGPVPLRTQATATDSDLYMPRSSVDAVYAQITQDLRLASALLPTRTRQPTTEFGRATKGAAQAILTKAALTYANTFDLKGEAGKAREWYATAKTYADSVINSNEYTLLSYNDLWNVDKERDNYREFIFGIQFTRDRIVAQAQAQGSEHGGRSMPSTMPNVSGLGTAKTGVGQWKVQPWFYDQCSTGDYAGDYRAERTFLTSFVNTANRRVAIYPSLPTGTDLTEPQPYVFKYVDGQALDIRNHESDFVITRLADVLLMKAEAENELNGPTAEAYVAFNRLRERARRADGVTTRTTPANLAPALTKDQFRQRIFLERGLELVGEGHRWFDLVRMKSPEGRTMYEYQFSTVLPKITPGLPRWNATARRWEGGRTEATNVHAFNARFLLFPVPIGELTANPNSQQNPGW